MDNTVRAKTTIARDGSSASGADGPRIVFVHTPMATLKIDEREEYWRNFDRSYHACHPGLRHMHRNIWELPHWMTWLAGVLEARNYCNLDRSSSEVPGLAV
jgi:hypothetical protein